MCVVSLTLLKDCNDKSSEYSFNKRGTLVQIETVKCNSNYVGVKCKCYGNRNGLCNDSCVVLTQMFPVQSSGKYKFFHLRKKRCNEKSKSAAHEINF